MEKDYLRNAIEEVVEYQWVIKLVQVVKEIKGHISSLYPLRSP
ncbi:MAG: hypothetical protein WA977_12365 [Halobacteriota archaeon]